MGSQVLPILAQKRTTGQDFVDMPLDGVIIRAGKVLGRARSDVKVPKVLVVHGAGMNMRGKAQVEVFGTMTLDGYNERIRAYADALGIAVSFFHSNIEGEVCDALYAAFEGDGEDEISGCIINPADYMTNQGPLRAAVARMRFPVIEVHLSNPAARGLVSTLQAVCKASICGFGIDGYRLALDALKNEGSKNTKK